MCVDGTSAWGARGEGGTAAATPRPGQGCPGSDGCPRRRGQRGNQLGGRGRPLRANVSTPEPRPRRTPLGTWGSALPCGCTWRGHGRTDGRSSWVGAERPPGLCLQGAPSARRGPRWSAPLEGRARPRREGELTVTSARASWSALRTGRDPGRFAGNETHLRPGSPALTLAGDSEHAVLPATGAASRRGPGRAAPSPHGRPCPNPSPRSSSKTALGSGQGHGPSGEKCRVSVTNRKRGSIIVATATVTPASFFGVSRPSPPQRCGCPSHVRP